MPSLTHNTPALRFPGYTGVWEQQPQLRFKNQNGEDYPKWEKDILDNVGTFIKGAPLSKNDISENGKPFILYGELYTTYNEITKHVIRRTKTDVADRYYSIAGDVVLPTSGETPDEISTATCVMTDGVILAGDLLIYRTIDNIDGRMMSYIINHQINNDISRIAQGKSVVHIQAKELGKISFEYPSLAEQRKIADFFSKLDDLLALHQRQTQTLKKLKQGLLQKMFPQDGESVPRLRFPGFTDTWKQQQLGNIATFINGRAYSQDELLEHGRYPVLRVGNFYTNDSWYYSDLELADKYYAHDGDLLYTWSATFGPHIWHGDTVIYHYHIWKIDLSHALNKLFALYLLEYDKNNLLENHNGSTMVHITKAGIENEIVLIPSDIQEQKQIGSFFRTLDDLIYLHEQYTVKLTHLKKGLLQKMFPQD